MALCRCPNICIDPGAGSSRDMVIRCAWGWDTEVAKLKGPRPPHTRGAGVSSSIPPPVAQKVQTCAQS